MTRTWTRIVIPMTLVALGCPGDRVDIEDKVAEAPPVVSSRELASIEAGLPGFCADGAATVEFAEPGQRFAFPFDLRAGETVRLETAADETLDTVVHLFGPGGGQLPVATDDDSGPGRLTVLETQAKVDGRHTALLTTFKGLGRGTVTLRVSVAGEPGCRTAPPVAAADLQGPSDLDLGTVAVGTTLDTVLTLVNEGGADAIVDRVTFDSAGATGFAFDWPCARASGVDGGFLPIGPAAGTTSSSCAGSVTVPAGRTLAIPVRYQAQDGNDASARLTFRSNDPEDLVVTLFANRQGPCVQVIPSPLDFGRVAPGTGQALDVLIRSCAVGVPTRVTGIRLEDPTDSRFALEDVPAASSEVPLELAPKASVALQVSYSPGVESPAGDTNALLIDSDAPSSPLRIEIAGRAETVEDPVCDFVILAEGAPLANGSGIAALTQLHLVDRSYDRSTGGTIANRTWSVRQPDGSLQDFSPSASVADVTFRTVLVGTHVFGLQVTNDGGRVAQCQQTIDADAPDGWRIELTWVTPGDADPTDHCPVGPACGADLDLHFLHPFATGAVLDPLTGGPYGYFDPKYDVYWMNAHPLWDPQNPDPLHQPILDMDDTDGAGPEILTFRLPDPTRCYRVGVHAYDDGSFGISYPQIRIWDSGLPVYVDVLTEGLRMGEMWDAGTVCEDEGGVRFDVHATTKGTPVVIPNYVAPF